MTENEIEKVPLRRVATARDQAQLSVTVITISTGRKLLFAQHSLPFLQLGR